MSASSYFPSSDFSRARENMYRERELICVGAGAAALWCGTSELVVAQADISNRATTGNNADARRIISITLK
jgi:hypothetical protein